MLSQLKLAGNLDPAMAALPNCFSLALTWSCHGQQVLQDKRIGTAVPFSSGRFGLVCLCSLSWGTAAHPITTTVANNDVQTLQHCFWYTQGDVNSGGKFHLHGLAVMQQWVPTLD